VGEVVGYSVGDGVDGEGLGLIGFELFGDSRINSVPCVFDVDLEFVVDVTKGHDFVLVCGNGLGQFLSDLIHCLDMVLQDLGRGVGRDGYRGSEKGDLNRGRRRRMRRSGGR
jgi:hypothetical protein